VYALSYKILTKKIWFENKTENKKCTELIDFQKHNSSRENSNKLNKKLFIKTSFPKRKTKKQKMH